MHTLMDFVESQRERLSTWSTEILLTALYLEFLGAVAACERRDMVRVVTHA